MENNIFYSDIANIVNVWLLLPENTYRDKISSVDHPFEYISIKPLETLCGFESNRTF